MTTEIPDKEIFFELSLNCTTRLISLLDRQVFSETFGSWHRSFWLHRTSDFSCAATQQGTLALALLYTIEHKGNRFFQNPSLLKYIEGAIKFQLTQQHSDGSYDEWYPNERGWAGPTGYLTYSLARTWELMRPFLPLQLETAIRDSCRRACFHLRNYEEKDILANHQAMALLAVAQVRHVFNDLGDNQAYENLLARFIKSTDSQEGWSLEYDGADPGYQTATLSFLARIHRINLDQRLLDLAAPMLRFISYFFFEEKSFAGSIGSRSTRNLFHVGFEYWAHFIPLAETLAAHSRNMLSHGNLLTPADQEDHYLIYRVPEFLEAYLFSKTKVAVTSALPCFSTDAFQQEFKHAKIICTKQPHRYFVVNIAKGGVLKGINISGKIFEDSGWVLKTQSKKIISNVWISQANTLVKTESDQKVNRTIVNPTLLAAPSESKNQSATNGSNFSNRTPNSNVIHIQGSGHTIQQPVFTVASFIAFRIFMLTFGIRSKWAQNIKKLIRSRIMTSNQKLDRCQYSRVFQFEKELKIVDQISISGLQPKSLWFGKNFVTRLVPQSRYFELTELEEPFSEPEPLQLNEFEKSGRLSFERKIDSCAD